MKKLTLLFLLVTTQIFAQKNKKEILIPFREKNLWGLSDTLGKIKVKPFANEIVQFSVGKKYNAKYIIIKEGKTSVIDENLNELLSDNKYDAMQVSGDYDEIIVFKNGNMGLYKSKKELIAPIYSKIKFTKNSSYIVEKNNAEGLINSKGILVIPVEYQDVFESWVKDDLENPQFVWVAENRSVRTKFYDEKIKINTEEKKLGSGEIYTQEGFGYTQQKKHDDSIKDILLKKYDDVTIPLRKNYAYVIKKGMHGVVDLKSMREIVKPIYDSQLEYVSEDKGSRAFIGVRNGKYGMILENNVIKAPFEYDSIKEDYGNFYITIKGNKKGLLILNSIYPIIPAKYLKIKREEPIPVNDHWQFGIFRVETENGNFGYLGENGVEYFRD
ncbi:hypothetical protein ACN9MN_06390 [Chryseobacterium sp. S-02]|uniref:hypothetical protein n=1 Tax=Chryseobacterium sp. S-02 TaxID=3404064 RepID=UPI003CEFC284